MAKVYVADDEKNIRELIASFLREQGLDVEIFETGDQLLLRFMEEEADVVILDVMMPGTNGVEIVTMLRKRSDVPIILLTAIVMLILLKVFQQEQMIISPSHFHR